MPKVSFYLRNEDVEAWKAIDKKTAWVHAMLDETGKLKNLTQDIMNMHVASKIESYKSNPHVEHQSTPKSPNPFFRDEPKFCKHNAVLGMCKKGCK